jgi:NAD(P)-dependent dehydrogenase (short-subunit alcohol dehydrogenase family)
MQQVHSGPMAGRTVLATGGSGGTGKATALSSATLGASMAITGPDFGWTEGAAREIAVGGHSHHFVQRAGHGPANFADLQGDASHSGAPAYNQSKLADIFFTYERARRLRGGAATANALQTGLVSTSFGTEDRSGAQRFFVPFMRPFMR